jgi:protein gp37
MRANYGGLVMPDGKDWTGEVRLLKHRLDRPGQWNTPKLVFVNPLADLFHNRVRIAWVEEIFDVMRTYHQHTYIVLTKRWQWMQHICPSPPLPNLLLGVSVHDRQSFDQAWPYLRETPAAGRVVSHEPALGPLGLPADAVAGDRRLAWVICGGESGKRARRMDQDWARRLRDQCAAAEIPFFFKQWGEWGPDSSVRVGKKKAGRLLDGRTWDARPWVRRA